MTDLVNISAEDALIVAVMGYAVVFLGLILLMAVVMACGRIMSRSAAEPQPEQSPVPRGRSRKGRLRQEPHYFGGANYGSEGCRLHQTADPRW